MRYPPARDRAHAAPAGSSAAWRTRRAALARRARSLGLWILLGLAAGTAAAQGAADDAAVPPDPPGRVGRISELSGPVNFVDGSSAADAAQLNWPITSGNLLATGNFGQAEVRIGSLALRLGGDTEVQFPRIDDAVIEIVVERGTLAVSPRSRDGLREIRLTTPRERVVLEDVGRYRIDVDRVPELTAVTTQAGRARVYAGDATYTIERGQRGEIFGGPLPRFQFTQTVVDPFDDWVYARDRRDDDARSAQYASPELTGIESLDDYGVWRSVPDYGEVWYPTAVPAGWAPYRDGHWAFIAPWGWTWIDDSPWGFAPFHYGRWALAGGSWCWVPGTYRSRPYYSPAMVAWYGSPGLSASVSIGGPVGWFPLGPGEVYLPGYQVSHRYIESVNISHVTNITQITVDNPPGRYTYQRNPAAATWVERDAMTAHRSIGRSLQSPPARWLQAPVARAPAVPMPPMRVGRPYPGFAPERRAAGAQFAPALPPGVGPAAVPGREPVRDVRPGRSGATPPPTPAPDSRREPNPAFGNGPQRSSVGAGTAPSQAPATDSRRGPNPSFGNGPQRSFPGTGAAPPRPAVTAPPGAASPVPRDVPAPPQNAVAPQIPRTVAPQQNPVAPQPTRAGPTAPAQPANGQGQGQGQAPGQGAGPEGRRPPAQGAPQRDSRERDQDRDRSRDR